MQSSEVYFSSSYRGYFYDSLSRLRGGLDSVHRDLAACVLDAGDLSTAGGLVRRVDSYSIVCPFNAHDVCQDYFLGFVTDEIVADINRGSCRVFFDNSNERCSERIIAGVVEALAARGVVNLEGVSVLCQDRRLVGRVPVSVLAHDFFVVRSADVLARQILPNLRLSDQPRRLFLCLNATPRPLRVWTIVELIRAGLWGPGVPEECCAVSFPGLDYSKESGLELDHFHAQLRQAGCPDPEVWTSWLQRNAPFVVDPIAATGNELADVIYAPSYVNTLASIVTETECLPGVQRITEKTFKAVAMGHLPIVVGNQDSMALLERFGFESFAAIVDQSYDSEFDLQARVHKAIQVAQDLRRRIAEQPQLVGQIRAIGAANMDWARTGFASHYARTWTQPILRQLLFVD
jgi:hypothetical protein